MWENSPCPPRFEGDVTEGDRGSSLLKIVYSLRHGLRRATSLITKEARVLAIVLLRIGYTLDIFYHKWYDS